MFPFPNFPSNGGSEAEVLSMYALELLAYLAGPQQEAARLFPMDGDGQFRQHNVRLDLRILSFNAETRLLNIPQHATDSLDDDLVTAFCNRYGEHPGMFSGSDFPEAIADIANMKASLLHDEFWKLDDLAATENAAEHIMRREDLKNWCTMAIRSTCRWFNLQQQAQAILDDLREKQDHAMNLIRVARTAQALEAMNMGS